MADLADVIFQTAEGRAVNDDLRTRIAGRLPALGLRTLIPHPGSLVRDPNYASAYYVAVDSLVDDSPVPFLLHLTLASAPANPVYPGAMLIGRLRPGGGREIVVDAVPFGPADAKNVDLFLKKIDAACGPKPAGLQSAIVVAAGDDVGRDLTAAFEAFRQIRKATNANLASFSDFPGAVAACSWAAIRAGWRAGFSLESPILRISDNRIPDGCTTFRVDATDAEPLALFGFVSRILRARRLADIELVFREPVLDLPSRLAAYKAAGVTPQMVCLPDGADRVAELAPQVRAAGATISFPATGLTPESARASGRAAGRFRCRIETPGASTEDIVALATQLRG